jgi:hypothetical protein
MAWGIDVTIGLELVEKIGLVLLTVGSIFSLIGLSKGKRPATEVGVAFLAVGTVWASARSFYDGGVNLYYAIVIALFAATIVLAAWSLFKRKERTEEHQDGCPENGRDVGTPIDHKDRPDGADQDDRRGEGEDLVHRATLDPGTVAQPHSPKAVGLATLVVGAAVAAAGLVELLRALLAGHEHDRD